MYSEVLYNSILKFYENQHMRITKDADQGVIFVTYFDGEEGSERSLDTINTDTIIFDDGFRIRFRMTGIKTKESSKPYVCVLLAYIQNTIKYGHFEINMDTGEVAFVLESKLPDDFEIDDDYMSSILQIGFTTLDTFADAIIPIMLGYSRDPEAAFKSITQQFNEDKYYDSRN